LAAAWLPLAVVALLLLLLMGSLAGHSGTSGPHRAAQLPKMEGSSRHRPGVLLLLLPVVIVSKMLV
jgi:hypothetical protein